MNSSRRASSRSCSAPSWLRTDSTSITGMVTRREGVRADGAAGVRAGERRRPYPGSLVIQLHGGGALARPWGTGLPSALRALREGLPCQKQPFQQRWCHHACVEAVLSVRRERAAGLPIRALIVSDRDVVRAGVAAVLRPYSGRVSVTGKGVGLTDALAEKANSTADLVILHARLT